MHKAVYLQPLAMLKSQVDLALAARYREKSQGSSLAGASEQETSAAAEPSVYLRPNGHWAPPKEEATRRQGGGSLFLSPSLSSPSLSVLLRVPHFRIFLRVVPLRTAHLGLRL